MRGIKKKEKSKRKSNNFFKVKKQKSKTIRGLQRIKTKKTKPKAKEKVVLL